MTNKRNQAYEYKKMNTVKKEIMKKDLNRFNTNQVKELEAIIKQKEDKRSDEEKKMDKLRVKKLRIGGGFYVKEERKNGETEENPNWIRTQNKTKDFATLYRQTVKFQFYQGICNFGKFRTCRPTTFCEQWRNDSNSNNLPGSKSQKISSSDGNQQTT